MYLSVSKHARMRMRSRHLSLEIINQTISEGTMVKDNTRNRVRYQTDKIVVVLVSPKVRNVVTVWSRMLTKDEENSLSQWKIKTRNLRKEIILEMNKRLSAK